MQRLIAGTLITSALLLAGCGGSGSFAPRAANPTAPASAARQFNSVSAAVAAGVLRPVCPHVEPGRARCVSYVHAPNAASAPQSSARSVSAKAPAPPPDGYGPADLQSAYRLTAAARSNGSDALIAIVDAYDDPHAEHDLAVYRAQYGLPPCTSANRCFRKVNQNGKAAPLPPVPTGDFAGWQVETALDLEMVSANCPKCKILLVESDDDFMNDLGAAVREAAEFEPVAISNSYVAQELPTDPGPIAQQGLLPYYVHRHIAVVAGAGDNNYMYAGAAYGPLIPAAFPSVVAVGGTELVPDLSSARGWSESAWFGTGSGCSQYEALPSWQTADAHCVGTFTGADGVTKSFPSRIYGDVAYTATGVAMYDSSGVLGPPGWIVLDGTSIGAPSIAAIYGLAGYGSGGGGEGDDEGAAFPARKLYASKRALFDVTTGNNGTCADTYLCYAGPGYDGPTGNGTPNGIGAF